MGKLTYKSSGVNYDLLDNLKRMAQKAGQETFDYIQGTNFKINNNSQGDSAFVVHLNTKPPLSLAFVQEGLGTKNLVADVMFKLTGRSYYHSIAQDTVAMIINDLITVGARPISVSAYWAVGSENWLKSEQMKDLVNGWKNACNLSGCAWTGGETPMLSGIINSDTIDLGGSAFGFVNEQKTKFVTGADLSEGDAIILFSSSGIHANGLSLARKLAENLSNEGGYEIRLQSGRTYGEALLDPTIIYAKLIQSLLEIHINIHYMVNITGHGWRKLMRNKNEKLQYVMNGNLPKIPEVLEFIKEQAELTDEEAYGNLNMGAGFAIFVPQDEIDRIKIVLHKYNNDIHSEMHRIEMYNAGVVKGGEKKVIIKREGKKDVVFASETLQVRA